MNSIPLWGGKGCVECGEPLVLEDAEVFVKLENKIAPIHSDCLLSNVDEWLSIGATIRGVGR